MPDSQIYLILGELQADSKSHGLAIQEMKRDQARVLDDLKKLITDSMDRQAEKDKGFDARLSSMELVVGRITVKLAAAAIVIVMFVGKGVDYVWENIMHKT